MNPPIPRSVLAVDASSNYRFGYAVCHPGGMILQGEFDESARMLDAVDTLLQNGLKWQMLVALPCVERVSGALWYIAAKHGADFSERPLPGTTDGQLRSVGMWRRGMSASNRAARLLLNEGTDTP